MKRLRLALIGFSAVAALAVGSSAAHAACEAGDCWGAVAYGPRGAFGYAYNFPTRGIAERRARNNCGGRCNHILTFHNSCGAYASGPSAYQHFGWGNADSRFEAEAIAMGQCNARGYGCRIRVWACTKR